MAYEELRGRVLGGSSRGSHVDLVVVLREGVATWISRGPAGGASERSAAEPDPAPRAAVPILSDEVHASVVRVLASMALSGRKEMSP